MSIYSFICSHRCSTPEDQAADLVTTHRDLLSSGYPSSFIQTIENSLAHTMPQQPQWQQKEKSIPIPYAPGISESLYGIFRSYEVDVAHAPKCKLRHAMVTVKERKREVPRGRVQDSLRWLRTRVHQWNGQFWEKIKTAQLWCQLLTETYSADTQDEPQKEDTTDTGSIFSLWFVPGVYAVSLGSELCTN